MVASSGVGIDFGASSPTRNAAMASLPGPAPCLSEARTSAVVHAVEGDAGSTYIATETFDDSFRLIKLGPTGTVSWSKTYALPGSDLPMGMVRFPNGDMWINGPDWLMACSPAGDVLWAHTLPHVALTMEATLEGDGVFLIGYAGSDGWLMRTDMNGQVADCTDSTLVPIVAPETLSAAPYGPPDPTISHQGYLSDFAPGKSQRRSVDCIPTDVPTYGQRDVMRAAIMLTSQPVDVARWRWTSSRFAIESMLLVSVNAHRSHGNWYQSSGCQRSCRAP